MAAAIEAAETLRSEGLDVGVVNARFIKPVDRDMIRKALTSGGFVVTVEEAMLMGGFGSAVLEAAAEMNLDTRPLTRIGIPDVFVQHGSREEVLAELNLDTAGIAKICRAAAKMNSDELVDDKNKSIA